MRPRRFQLALVGLLCAQPITAGKLLEVHCTQPFAETMLQLQSAISGNGYTISRVQFVDKGLAAAGYATGKYRVVFFGKARDFDWIRENKLELLALLPLQFTVRQEGEHAAIVGLDPATFADIYPDPLTQRLFLRWSSDVKRIIEDLPDCTG